MPCDVLEHSICEYEEHMFYIWIHGSRRHLAPPLWALTGWVVVTKCCFSWVSLYLLPFQTTEIDQQRLVTWPSPSTGIQGLTFLYWSPPKGRKVNISRQESSALKTSCFLWTPACVFQLSWDIFSKETEKLCLFSNTSSTSKYLLKSHLCVALCYLCSSSSSVTN